MNKQPNPNQALLLWRILAYGGPSGEVMQKDLGTKVVAGDRQELIRLGFLEAAKAKAGALRLTVTDAGWEWAGEHLDAPLPPKATSGIAPLLHKWLSLLQRHLKSNGISLAEVFQPTTGASAPPIGDWVPTTLGADADPRLQLRSAYFALTGGQVKTRCLLRDLRARLREMPRETIDRTIIAMVRSGEAVLFRLDNRLEITPADTAGAIIAGGEPQHILWIDR
jgi:hypothetical protein